MTSPQRAATVLDTRRLDDLAISDEPSFRHVGLYADLKQIVRRSGLLFRVLPSAGAANWDRALLLNLTYWRPDAGGDVLVDETIPADVVTHVAWHHLSAKVLAPTPGAPQSVEALFMGEAIASAFDLYLVGRLLGHAPDSAFLETQVPAMKEVAEAAGLDEAGFEALMKDVADAPERAFSELRTLLFDACTALYACTDVDGAYASLARLDGHRLAPLLHRYELSNWILYARALGRGAAGRDPGCASDAQTHALDGVLRESRDPLDWLAKEWVVPALTDH